MNKPVVIKVGGSLFDWPLLGSRLREFLLAEPSKAIVLIAGGGKLVDAVRAMDKVHGLGEATSHQLALRALDVTARLLASLIPGLEVIDQPEMLEDVWESRRIPVLAPRFFMESYDAESAEPLPETWETTSDSIAARYAEYIKAAELVLVKSDLPERYKDRAEAAKAGFVDPIFPWASRHLKKVWVVNLKAEPFQGYDLDVATDSSPE